MAAVSLRGLAWPHTGETADVYLHPGQAAAKLDQNLSLKHLVLAANHHIRSYCFPQTSWSLQ